MVIAREWCLFPWALPCTKSFFRSSVNGWVSLNDSMNSQATASRRPATAPAAVPNSLSALPALSKTYKTSKTIIQQAPARKSGRLSAAMLSQTVTVPIRITPANVAIDFQPEMPPCNNLWWYDMHNNVGPFLVAAAARSRAQTRWLETEDMPNVSPALVDKLLMLSDEEFRKKVVAAQRIEMMKKLKDFRFMKQLKKREEDEYYLLTTGKKRTNKEEVTPLTPEEIALLNDPWLLADFSVHSIKENHNQAFMSTINSVAPKKASPRPDRKPGLPEFDFLVHKTIHKRQKKSKRKNGQQTDSDGGEHQSHAALYSGNNGGDHHASEGPDDSDGKHAYDRDDDDGDGGEMEADGEEAGDGEGGDGDEIEPEEGKRKKKGKKEDEAASFVDTEEELRRRREQALLHLRDKMLAARSLWERAMKM